MYTDILVVRIEIKKRKFIDPPLTKSQSFDSIGIEIQMPPESEIEKIEKKRFVYKIFYSVFD